MKPMEQVLDPSPGPQKYVKGVAVRAMFNGFGLLLYTFLRSR